LLAKNAGMAILKTPLGEWSQVQSRENFQLFSIRASMRPLESQDDQINI